MTPVGVIRATSLTPGSVNHMLPSGPAAMAQGRPLVWNSVTSPWVVIRATLFPTNSVNHRLPSGPTAMYSGVDPTVGMGKALPLGRACAGLTPEQMTKRAKETPESSLALRTFDISDQSVAAA